MRALFATSMALALSLGGLAVMTPVSSPAQVEFGVSVSVGVPPPPLPLYDQPPIPGPGYIWTPGYWAWSDYDQDYYWVPGTWVLPPRIGYLWTPPWWGFDDGVYAFHDGYWGPVVGFYGGIDYGWGYGGYGYEGGYWRGDQFYYNRTVNNITYQNITSIYERPVSAPVSTRRVSFNGPGGVEVRPTPQQLYALRAPRLAPTPMQQQHFRVARTQPDLRASVNRGAPPIAATLRPAMLRGPGVVPAVRAGGPYRPATGFSRAQPGYGQAPLAGPRPVNGGYRTPGSYVGGYNGAYRATQSNAGQGPGAAPQRYNGPARPPGAPGFASTYQTGRQPMRPPMERYGAANPAAPRGYPAAGGGYRPPPASAAQSFNPGFRPAPRAAESYSGPFRAAPQSPGGVNAGYRPAPRPPENFGAGYHPAAAGFGGGYRPPARPEASPGAAFRPPPVSAARVAQPAPQARPAAPPERERREPPRP